MRGTRRRCPSRLRRSASPGSRPPSPRSTRASSSRASSRWRRCSSECRPAPRRPMGSNGRGSRAARAAPDEWPVRCRNRGLAVYAVRAKPPAYELNYPDGDGEPDFWFVLDAAIAQERIGTWLDLLEPVSEEETRAAAAELLRW